MCLCSGVSCLSVLEAEVCYCSTRLLQILFYVYSQLSQAGFWYNTVYVLCCNTGCVFGRNVAMWNAIQARHPAQAAQLSDSSAVITYHPTSPVRSTSRDQADARPPHQSIANEHALHGRGRSTEFIQSVMHTVMVRNQVEQQNPSGASMAPGVDDGGRSPTSPGAASSSTASRVGLGLLAPLRLDSRVVENLSASSSTAESASVSQYPAVATGTRPSHLLPTRVPRSATDVSFASTNQSEHLRRAQAAFADLRVRDLSSQARRNASFT